MASSLKEENKIALFTVLVVNLAVFYLAVQTDAIFVGDWTHLTKGFIQGLPAGLGLMVIGIVNAQFSSEDKARIVFLRWNNALPGCEAFTKHAPRDPRIDLEALKRQYGPLPTDPAAQNKLWYKIYKSVESKPPVLQAHREFLFARDYTCLALMIFILLSVCAFIWIPSIKTALIYSTLLIIQLILAMRAARHNGFRFVTNVLAIKAATGRRTNKSNSEGDDRG